MKGMDYFDGLSFCPTLLGRGEQQQHEYLYWEFAETNQMAVRMGDWKMVVKKGVPELYNLANDIHEDHNVAVDHPDIVNRMKEVIYKEHVDSEYFKVTLPK